jgi:hypothetical protein
MFYDETQQCYQIFLNARSTKVQTYHHLLHVIPPGMFQPQNLTTQPQREFSVRHVFLREFYEELYRAKIVERDKGNADHKFFYRHHPVARLIQALDSGKAHLYFTGLGINLMNLRTDICVLLLIRDPMWFVDAPPKLNFEHWVADGAEPVPPRNADKIKILCALNKHLEIAEPHNQNVRSMNTVPMAAAAIELGLELARKIIAPKPSRP